MIRITRINGDPFALNPDLIERIDAHPDTVITLVDDTRYVVREPVDEVLEQIKVFRAEILVLAGRIEQQGLTPAPTPRTGGLTVVPTPTEEH